MTNWILIIFNWNWKLIPVKQECKNPEKSIKTQRLIPIKSKTHEKSPNPI